LNLKISRIVTTNNNGTPNERKSTCADRSEVAVYKRMLEDSQVKIESYKRIIESKDEAIQDNRKTLEEVRRKNQVSQTEITDVKKNYNILLLKYSKLQNEYQKVCSNTTSSTKVFFCCLTAKSKRARII
jgi:chromosome segregation ATPase